MSNNQILEMSKVIGQIEDELRDIKSAKEQVEAVIGSNKALSDSLQALFDSANNVAKALENNAQQIIADTTNKLEMLSIQASDIDSYVQQGMTKISKQSALAQSKLEDELGNLLKLLMGTISTSTNQSLETVGNELAGFRVLVHEAAQKFTDSASNTIAKQEGQIVEIGKLVACIQERQCALDSKIEEIKQLDILRLIDEISEIRRTELGNATVTKKWRVVELSAFGVCIILGIAILIRLLVM
jgi:ABC-type transporter Mla subunit MlaD